MLLYSNALYQCLCFSIHNTVLIVMQTLIMDFDQKYSSLKSFGGIEFPATKLGRLDNSEVQCNTHNQWA